MLPRVNRVQSWFFRNLRKPAFSVSTPTLSVKVYKSEKDKKFAVIVSKKVAKNAVERNSIRRKVFVCIQERIEEIPNGIYLIYPQKDFSSKDLSEAFLKRPGM